MIASMSFSGTPILRLEGGSGGTAGEDGRFISRLFDVVYVDSSNSGAAVQDGSSWNTAYSELTDALAHTTTGSIWVADGTYLPDPDGLADPRNATFRLVRDVTIYGGFSGNETSLAQRDLLANPTILSGDLQQDDDSTGTADNAYHVVSAIEVYNSTLDGFIITGGHANGAAANRNHLGGGIVGEEDGILTLRNVTVIGNQASGVGGGAYFNNFNLTLVNCSFAKNDVVTDSDGPSGPLGEGGAMYLNGCDTRFTNTVFVKNEAADKGGALSLHGTNLDLFNGTLVGNHSGTSGGALYVTGNGTLYAYNSILWANTAALSNDTLLGTLRPSSLHNLLEGGTVAASSPVILNSDPVFVRAPETNGPEDLGDLRLLPTSPAIGQGIGGVNPSTTDRQGGNRNLDIIDLGAFESTGTEDCIAIWNTDLDGDGAPFGVEFSLGTDPDVADFDLQTHFALTYTRGAGSPVQLSAGVNPLAIGKAVWIIERSIDLQQWNEIYRSENPGGSTILFVDPDQPSSHAYYRFKAELKQP